MKRSLAWEVAAAAWATVTPDFEEWGRLLIESLREKGIYVNRAKGDVSGRW